jgi:hypothetical protein
VKKVLSLLLVGFLLFILEFSVLFLCFILEVSPLDHISYYSVQEALRGACEIGLLRLIFYLVPWVFFVHLFYDMIPIKIPLLKLAVVNCGLYVSTSLLLCVPFPGAFDYFAYSFFYYLVFATFVSPFLLCIVPVARNRVKSSLVSEVDNGS